MEDITKRILNINARMLIHAPDFDDSRQAFSTDELNDRLCDYIDKVIDTYKAHKNCIHDACKYTALMVLGIAASVMSLALFITFIILACWGEMDTITTVLVCLFVIAFIVFAAIQTDIFNDKRKNYKDLAESLQIKVTDLYLGVIIITWPLTHKEE